LFPPAPVRRIAAFLVCGRKLAVLYRDGDENFRENTFMERWLWSGIMLIMAGMSFISLPVCRVIFKMPALPQFKK